MKKPNEQGGHRCITRRGLVRAGLALGGLTLGGAALMAMSSERAFAAGGSLTVTEAGNFADIYSDLCPWMRVSGAVGSVAYCGESKLAPPSAGTTYAQPRPIGNRAVDFAVYYGEGSPYEQANHYGLDDRRWWLATQYVVWLALGDTEHNSASHVRDTLANMPASRAGIEAFYNDAMAYAAGPAGPADGCAMWYPSPSPGSIQSLVAMGESTGTARIAKAASRGDWL